MDSAVKTTKDALPIAAELRPYTPDLIGGLFDGFGGNTGGYYDANGHYARISFQSSAYSGTGLASLLPLPDHTDGLVGFRKDVNRRCPGAATQALADGSNPYVPDLQVVQQGRHAEMRRLVSIAIIVAAGVASLLLAGAGGGRGPQTYRVDALFYNASHLIPGQEVKIAGAEVGSVKNVTLTKDRRARVQMAIDKRFAPFRGDAHCTIRPQSLIGEKFVQCVPGTPKAPELKGQNGQAPTIAVDQNQVPVDLDQVFDALRLPYRERFTLIINELGTGLAGSAEGPQHGDPPREPGARPDQQGPEDRRRRPRAARHAHRRVRHGARPARRQARAGQVVHRPLEQGRRGGRRPQRRARPDDRPAAGDARAAPADGERPDRAGERDAAGARRRARRHAGECASWPTTSSRSTTPRGRR